MEKDYHEELLNSREERTQKDLLLLESNLKIGELTQKLSRAEAALEKSAERVTQLTKKSRTMKAHISRFPKQTQMAVDKALLKEKKKTGLVKTHGVVSNDMRALIRNLVAQGVTPEHVYPVIQLVTQTYGLDLEGSFSARTVTRVMVEGLAADDLHVAEAVQNAKAITYSGDGTTIRGITQESQTINVIGEDGSRNRFSLGVHSAVNHSAETQVSGLKSQVRDIFSTYNSSLEIEGKVSSADERTFGRKLSGAITDHAVDQKKMIRILQAWKTQSDRSLRGEESLLSKPPEELLPIILEMTNKIVERAGGQAAWDTLPEQSKLQLHNQGFSEVCEEFGEQEFQKLSPAEKETVGFFAWVGCCMHKELNTVKGGYSAMEKFWKIHNILGLVNLPNKDAAAAISGGVEPVKAVQGGAVKTTTLAGAIFNHRDDKKGEQDSLRCAFEAAFGFPLNFPDTSNTRYQSHCEAAAELIVNLPFYRQYLLLMKDRKESRTLNHMERNLQIALDDIPTISELCILAIFLLCISRPYMHVIREAGHDEHNILDMGPFHSKVEAHMERIIADPMLILAFDAKFESATMDGKPWDRPEVMYAIWRLQLTLPHLKGLLVSFFTGALETWRRFTSEFAPGGLISNASPTLRALAWMPTTNDVNEGSLGSRRVLKRSFPKATELVLNSIQRYKWNKTGNFIRNISPDKLIYLRKQARYIQSLNIQFKLHIAQVEYDQAVVKHRHALDAIKLEKKNKAVEVLAQVKPIISLQKFEAITMKNSQLDLQLL
ncbi:hypothetical protein M422DRAFT_171470 [Sphaerobolus stellatus SS14]|uniref:Uncharacterized protein n=1 Tax=Sphaerobolus stellatus (strain SS14) TaxID=990650 RepID=A0A0C9VU64_SPHS4|nr:hypothetical protein M422DRAFT_171470 [Sphaerobolus stellatus SS14]